MSISGLAMAKDSPPAWAIEAQREKVQAPEVRRVKAQETGIDWKQRYLELRALHLRALQEIADLKAAPRKSGKKRGRKPRYRPRDYGDSSYDEDLQRYADGLRRGELIGTDWSE